MSFENLGLAPELVSVLKDKGYSKPTEIQRKAIPQILKGFDLIAGAQTGTGKTAAFSLPILQKLMDDFHPSSRHTTQVLILTPTRELASQVHENINTYSQNLNLRNVVLFGGASYGAQIEKLKAGADMVVATPGRLMDLLEQGHVKFQNLKYLVVDEADRMLDMGFIPEVRRLMSQLPRNRQTLFFSATFTPEVKGLASVLLKQPVTIQAEKSNSAANTITHIVHPVDAHKKRALLSYLIGSNNWQQVLIFTRTKVSADNLSKELALDGIRNKVIHGDRTQGSRTKALALFKERKIQALVATDIAARGLDIDNLPHVINYELPNIPEDYVHRVGRTGRAGMDGHAVTLVTDKEVFRLEAVEKLIKMELRKKRVDGFEPTNFDPEAVARKVRQEKYDRHRSRRQTRSHASKADGKPGSKTASKKSRPHSKTSGGQNAGPGANRKGGKPGSKTASKKSRPHSKTSGGQKRGIRGRPKA